MFECVRTQYSRARGLVGSTNRKRRVVTEADTTYVDPSAVCVHNQTLRKHAYSNVLKILPPKMKIFS